MLFTAKLCIFYNIIPILKTSCKYSHWIYRQLYRNHPYNFIVNFIRNNSWFIWRFCLFPPNIKIFYNAILILGQYFRFHSIPQIRTFLQILNTIWEKEGPSMTQINGFRILTSTIFYIFRIMERRIQRTTTWFHIYILRNNTIYYNINNTANFTSSC